MTTLQNRRIVSGVAIILSLGYGAAAWGVEFAGGTGEPNDPYQITTAEHLAGIGSDRELLTRHYVLVNDIDLDPNLPGGRVFPQSLIAPELRGTHGVYFGYFQGVFDGGGHVIRNLTIRSEKEQVAGLFGYVDLPAQIRNLGLEGVEIRRTGTGSQAFTGGGLVAVNAGGAILGCYATGSAVETFQFTPRIGDTDSDCVGGLIGVNRGLVHACYSRAEVQGDGIVGGLVGVNGGAVHFSFAAGVPYGSGRVGGLVGRSDIGSVLHSYWDQQVSGVAESAGGLGKTSAEMMSRGTYAPGVHTGAWTLDDGQDYPHLSWEQAPGTPIGDVPPGYGGGSGAAEDPYQIATTEQFIAIAYRPQDFDKGLALTADLDFNDVDSNEILPIGLKHLAFSGRFDGGSHNLSNLSILRPDDQCVGVFGIVGPPNVFPRGQTIDYDVNENDRFGWGYGQSGSRSSQTSVPASRVSIKNLHLCDVTVVGREYVGGLIGLGQAAVEDCSVSGEITGLSMVGGLVGRSLRVALSRCSLDTQVTGEFAVGGLVGATWLGNGLTAEDCLVRGVVTGQLFTGGLIGFAQGPKEGDSVSRCSAECDVRGQYFTGGCFGSTTGAVVTMSCARGSVTGQSWLGGFAGEILHATVSDSYCVVDVVGERKAGGFSGRCRNESIARCYAASSVGASDIDPQCSLAGAFISHAGSLNDRCLATCIVEAEGCFWDAEASGPVAAVGNCPLSGPVITGLTTAQMQTAAPFVAAGWNFEGTWTICEGQDYPRLRWEGVECTE